METVLYYLLSHNCSKFKGSYEFGIFPENKTLPFVVGINFLQKGKR